MIQKAEEEAAALWITSKFCGGAHSMSAFHSTYFTYLFLIEMKLEKERDRVCVCLEWRRSGGECGME